MVNKPNKIELLAPAGNMEKLMAAVYFGADAVYLAGKKWGLRAQADNFEEEGIVEAVKYAHEKGVKVYVTLNIFAHETDFEGLDDYIRFLAGAGVDAVIVSDLGVMSRVKAVAPKLDIHISTQASVTNVAAAAEYVKLGAKRIILARELGLGEIAKIRAALSKQIKLEAFVHGAMCMGYSGRCLISNYLTGRDANRGDCAQACRWKFEQAGNCGGGELLVEEDARGSYIFNSKDLCMIEHIDKLADAGIESFKIEGRVKSAYYVATVTNAYRRALSTVPDIVLSEVYKVANRGYSTGFYLGNAEQNLVSSQATCQYEFVATVVESWSKSAGYAVVEQRNRFKAGEILEVLSPNDYHNAQIAVGRMAGCDGAEMTDAKFVQQKIRLYTGVPLQKGDMLRKEI